MLIYFHILINQSNNMRIFEYDLNEWLYLLIGCYPYNIQICRDLDCSI